MDKFDTSVSLLISAIVGAGVFALPALAKNVGLLSIGFISVAFFFMLGLGYVVIEMSPSTIEEEVENHFGPTMRKVLKAIEFIIMFLALTAYAIGLKEHLAMNDFLIFALFALPLILELRFPAGFTQFLAFFILVFVSVLTLGTIPMMEIHSSVTSMQNVTLFSSLAIFFASLFAFFGHNMIPRVRFIIRNKEKTRKVFYTSLSIVFLLYLPFSIAVSGTGVTGLATKYLAQVFSSPFGSLVDLLAVVLFYTSFVIYGFHLLGEIGYNSRGLLIVLFITAIFFAAARFFIIPFEMLIVIAGFFVSLYAAFASAAAIKAGKQKKLASYLLGIIGFLWIFVIISAFV